jgi:hypothetical protein
MRLGPAFSLNFPLLNDHFLDVVHHAVQIPLGVDLASTTQGESIHLLVVPDVAEHRLHCSDSLAIEPATRLRVNRLTY